MKNILFVFVFGFLLLSCDHKKIVGDDYVVLDSLMSEKLKIAFIDDTAYTKTPWIPTYNQLKSIDSIIVTAIKNRKDEYYEKLASDSINNYYRQYVFSIDSNGDSLVFINAVCYVDDYPVIDKNDEMHFKRDDWQHEIGNVKDGGDCYWQIMINISTRQCRYLIVNGYA
jgi:hypothetical protein